MFSFGISAYPGFGKQTTLMKLSHALFPGTSHASSLYSLLRLFAACFDAAADLAEHVSLIGNSCHLHNSAFAPFLLFIIS